MRTYKLLPYKWQYWGWSFSFIGFIVILFTLLQEYNSYQMGYFLFEVGFLLIAFTREKDEDERVQSIRFKSLVTTAILYIALYLLRPVLQTIIVRFIPFEIGTIILNITVLFNMIPLYVVIFKGTLYFQNKKLSYDKQYPC